MNALTSGFGKIRRKTARAARKTKKLSTAAAPAVVSASAAPAATAPAETPAPAVAPAPAETTVTAEAAPAAPAPAPLYTQADAEAVFRWFREISKIPRGSGNTKGISDYIAAFAAERGLEYRQDELGNVLIRKAASKGAEQAPGIALQGHIDMVCEQENGRDIDMTAVGPVLMTEGDWLTADGTTLGADNGIAAAMMLALLDDREAVHPMLECIFTVDEEIGLLGADFMDLSDLQSRQMMNLDSEQEGVFTAGCAGGAEVHVTIPVKTSHHTGIPVDVTVSGLLGGHSGEMIGRGRANADLVLARLLYSLLEEMSFRLISMQGGNKDNAIPRSAQARILLPADSDPDKAQQILEEHAAKIAAEYSRTDGELSVEISAEIPADGSAPADKCTAIGRGSTRRILQYLVVTPDGVLEYDPSFPGLPQTSLNLGVLRVDEKGMTAIYLLRSSVNSQREALEQKIRALAAAFEAKMVVKSAYPAWEFLTESPFRDRLILEYERQNGEKPSVKMTHGGLECGILSAKVEGLDCISLGPDMYGVHTPEEHLSIPSTVRVWNFLKGALQTFAGTAAETAAEPEAEPEAEASAGR